VPAETRVVHGGVDVRRKHGDEKREKAPRREIRHPRDQQTDAAETLEHSGGPHTVQCVVEAIVLPSVQFSEQDEIYGSHFNRYLVQRSLADTDLVDSTLEGRWNRGYQRCLTHLRRLLAHLSRSEQNRRFLFLGSYISTLLAQREFMLADPGRTHPTWRSKAMLDDIIRTATALLTAAGPGR